MKYSILIPFYNRSKELTKTLESYNVLYRDRGDIEILIGEDIKNREHNQLMILVNAYGLTIFKTGTLECLIPCISFNELAGKAQGEILIITNPECVHVTDILKGLDEEFLSGTNKYIICACEAVNSDMSHYM